ncbi:hypothetical protein V6N12_036687 [Hibiscus sabdariffa]|uniref:ENTH domain-containing protein n=1 Tax=Hibiscus sabdariffa TaxID=183260 RepID=A0ABR2ERF4_9ROSI
MGLWNRVSGVIKDKNSVVLANLSGKTSFRNPVLETAIINATSHDDCRFDKRNAQTVFSWIRSSPISLLPLDWALSRRMEKTRSWVVAIKGLMLMHGAFNCKDPGVQNMGRLPFDLSTLATNISGGAKRGQLSKLRKWQSLLDTLLQVKPRAENMKVGLILEAMDCIIVEIYDVYSRIRTEITKVLSNLQSVTKSEAAMALKILRKATAQSKELASFHEFCKEFGVLNAGEIPTATQIPEEKVKELQRIINGVSDTKMICKDEEEFSEEKSAIVEYKEEVKGALKTVITEKWVGFEIENTKIYEENNEKNSSAEESNSLINHVPDCSHREIPDLICF